MQKLLCFIVIVIHGNLYAQNLDRIGDKNMVQVSGGVNYNLVANQVDGQTQYRDPFAWVFSSNLTLSILDFSLPFTCSFSNSGSSYTQPFNMTAFHPTYKNWKAHIGITSMSFSPYTYQGMNFTGGGLEYTPKKWSVKVFGGRLKKAVEYDESQNNLSTVSYKRYGYGLSLGFKQKIFNAEFIAFKAWDDGTSLKNAPENNETTVRDNAVFSIKASVKPVQSISISLEVASSLLTKDVLMNDPALEQKFYHKLVRGNQTTEFNQAYNASIDYRLKFFGIGIKYERIDPRYSTLGAIYFNNDLENITLNPTFSLFKNKINFNFSTGYQRNNLNALKATQNKRWIGSANLSASIIKGLNFNATYSNVSSFSKRNPASDPFYNVITDTLNYYQISQNTSASLNYAFGDSLKQTVNLTGSYSKSENIVGSLQDAGAFGLNAANEGSSLPTDVYNAMFTHRLSMSKSRLSIGWSVNWNSSNIIDNQSTFFGPGINLSKMFKEAKISLNSGITYNAQYLNEVLQSHVMNYRIGVQYNPEWWDKKYGKFNISINSSFVDRLPVTDIKSIKNLTIITNLSYQF